jgi:hypothetical protein
MSDMRKMTWIIWLLPMLLFPAPLFGWLGFFLLPPTLGVIFAIIDPFILVEVLVYGGVFYLLSSFFAIILTTFSSRKRIAFLVVSYLVGLSATFMPIYCGNNAWYSNCGNLYERLAGL